MDAITKLLRVVKTAGLYPEIVKVSNDNSEDPYFLIDGKRTLSFNSCNYLGLSNDKNVKTIIGKSFIKHGIHPSNSTLVGGLWDVHREFESRIARFFGYEDCMLFSSTGAVNEGVIPAIANLPISQFLGLMKIYTGNTETTIFSDELNHATIVDGCKIAKVPLVVYKHMDFTELEKALAECKTQRKIIITDGIFSMDGHIVNLPELVKLKKKYNCLLVVDDAHSVGVLDNSGRGIQYHYGIKPSEGVDFYIASLSKGFGLVGGCVCASKDYIDYLRVTARSYIFSRTYLAPFAEGGIEVINILESERGKALVKKLWENTNYLLDSLNRMGFNTLKTQTPIIPILVGDEKKAIKISKNLSDNGIYLPAMRWPAVAKNMARLRFMVTALHEKKDLDRLLQLLEKNGKKMGLVK